MSETILGQGIVYTELLETRRVVCQERAAGYQGRSVDGLERVEGGHRMQGDV